MSSVGGGGGGGVCIGGGGGGWEEREVGPVEFPAVVEEE